ncbi:hypothetical protein R1sor_007955 [Riccia sorocarpa]|uniref:Uncharacterized protein n=1 Tax=Riccia sorocarpa TaxID=122646 RepID=A0ABD3HVF7_9MARC
MAPTLPRSTLEEMLESMKKTDEKQRDMPPALPQRPTSRGRLPSSVRARKSASSSSDKSRQSGDGHMRTPRPCKAGSNSESPGTSTGGSPPKSERSVDSGRVANGTKPASPKSRPTSSSNSPSGSVNVGRSAKDKDEAEVNSNGNKISHEHTVRNATSGERLPENGITTPAVASSSSAAAANSRKWKDESLSALKKGKLIDIHFDTAGKICGAKIQTLVRGAKARREYKILKERHYATITIQKYYRRRAAVSNYKVTLHLIVILQSAESLVETATLELEDFQCVGLYTPLCC